MPAEMGWIIKRDATDLTSRSLQECGPSEGHVYRARGSGMDDQT